jgi:polysaccharide export outer membrane protein
MVRAKLKVAGAARTVGVLVFFAACVAGLTGCNGVPGDDSGFAPKPPAADNAELARVANKYLSAAAPGSASYLIGPQDVLDIAVFQAPELSKTVLVANDGAINLPLVGQIPAAGKSPSELERDVERRLNARFLKSAQVTITVKEYNSQRITVEGAVRSPGVHPWRGSETLMQVIATSGGIDSNVASNDIVVFRTINGARTVTRYDFAAIHSGAEADPRLEPGDVVAVDESTGKIGLNYFLRVLPVAGMATPFLM